MSLQTCALGALLGLCLLLGFGYDRARTQRDAAMTRAESAEQARDNYAEASGLWERTAFDARDALKDCREQWQEALATADDLRRQQALGDAERAALAAQWQARWDSRTPSCGAALLDMERACTDELGAIE